MIYILHTEDDVKIALNISLRLEEAGFSTYIRKHDNHESNSETLASAKAVLLIVSPFSILSYGKFRFEIEVLKQTKKSLLPLLYGMSRAEFDTKKTEWKTIIGSSATAQIKDETVGEIIPKLVTVLKGLGENPNSKLDAEKISEIHSQISEIEKIQKNISAAQTTTPEANNVKRKSANPFVYLAAAVIVIAFSVFGYFQMSESVVEERTLLRLHGSNTIGAVLGPALVEEFVKKSGGINVQWKSGEKPEEKKIVFALPDSTVNFAIEIFAHGSSYAFRDLADSKCDIGMSSRQIKDEEAALLKVKGLGDMLSPTNESVLALDGLAIIVHPSNPIRSLSIEQVAKIFSGEIANWKSITNVDALIRLYARDSMSGTTETFRQLVFHRYKITKFSPDSKLFENSNELSREVANDPSGIGFVSFAYANESKVVAISEEADGASLYPNFLTVGREDYPLSRRLYLYTSAKPENELVRKFINFTLSENGQHVVETQKFVDLNLRLDQHPPLHEKALLAYNDFVKDSKRLSVNFRFQSGKDNFDTKASADLERIVSFVKKQGYPRLKLIGFTDDEGDEKMNLELSAARAQQVEKEFRQRGISLIPEDVVGFGKEMSLASNTTTEGKRKNRRVEVWIE